MAILDRAKAAAGRAGGQLRHGVERGRERRGEMQAKLAQVRLLRRVGEACYAEHRGTGTHEAVVRALADLDAHALAHPETSVPAGTAAAGTTAPRQARDIMHRGAECVGENETVAAAAQKMRDLGVGSLPICGADDRLHGVLTDRDIVVRCIAAGIDPAGIKVGDLAQGNVFWVDATADVGEVLRQMEDHRIKRMPVIENHRLVGMISEADLARNLDEHQLAEFVGHLYATA